MDFGEEGWKKIHKDQNLYDLECCICGKKDNKKQYFKVENEQVCCKCASTIVEKYNDKKDDPGIYL